ncbi:Predicted acid phosphatase [alpha proteobacterium BAL199]|jgi:5'-nucleotidase|nr:Predicted acid phosphatase [alpha proteobacterium BAL199]
MTTWPMELATSRILVSNDDGIEAPGIKVLARIAASLSDDVWIVAPEIEQSGAGHSLTLRRPLRIRKVEERRYGVDGTPTDCVLLAINEILKDHKPTLVLSGVNRGGNLGEDVTYSGTVAAAMEGTVLGVPSIALSQEYPEGGPVPWETVETLAPDLIRRLCAIGWPRNSLININFPAVGPDSVTGVLAAAQGRRKIGDQITTARDPRGAPYYWIGSMRTEDPTVAGTDINAVYRNAVAVTPISMNMTDHPTLTKLAETFH